MVVTIGGACLGFAFILLSLVLKPHEWKPTGHGTGIITSITSDGRNNIRFHIRFKDQGENMEGISKYYKDFGNYQSGDTVHISWLYNKLGDPCIRVEDNTLIPIGEGTEWFHYVFLVLGIIIVIVALAKGMA